MKMCRNFEVAVSGNTPSPVVAQAWDNLLSGGMSQGIESSVVSQAVGSLSNNGSCRTK